MVFEILGVNLLEIMKRFNYKGIPIPLVRRIAKQVLMGLDYLHRICKIIHTDLKPENVIVCLTKQELEEIVKRGQLSTVNKTIITENNQALLNYAANFGWQKKTLLQDVDTTGMTKQQKKKLKKKIRKVNQAANPGQDLESEFSESNRNEREYRRHLADVEDYYDNIELDRPRSYSLPNKAFNSEHEEGSNAYMYTIDRDFRAEIQQYMIEKAQLKRLRE